MATFSQSPKQNNATLSPWIPKGSPASQPARPTATSSSSCNQGRGTPLPWRLAAWRWPWPWLVCRPTRLPRVLARLGADKPSWSQAGRVGGLWPVLAQTNPPVRGGVSMDRSVMAALPGTTPRLVRKSSSDGLAWQHCMWVLQLFGKERPRPFSRGRGALPLAWARQAGLRPKVRPAPNILPPNAGHTRYRCLG